MNKIEIDSFLRFKYVSAPTFSPDGRFVAFIVQQPDLEGNCYKGDIWLLDAKSKNYRRLTSAGDAKSFVWTKDGKLLFGAVRDQKLKDKLKSGEQLSCFYEIDPEGGEATLSFTVPLFVGSVKPIDSDRFVLVASYDNLRPDTDVMSDEEKAKALKKLANPAYEVLEEAPFWFNGAGFIAGKRQRIYIFDKTTNALTAVTEPWFDTGSVSIRGEKLLFTGTEWQGMRDMNRHSGIYLYDIATRETKTVLPKNTIRTEIVDFWDDETLILTASTGEQYGFNRYCDFYTLGLNGGGPKLLCEYEASIGDSSVGSDARLGHGRGFKAMEDKAYFITTLVDGGYLRYVDKNGALSSLLTPDGSCDSFDVFDGHIVNCGMYGGRLDELYLDGEQVTFFSDEFLSSHILSKPIFHSFVGSDSVEIHGWAMKPVGYEEGKKYPAILHIHGGPRTVFGDIYHHEMQVWANAGYFVFYCNPRGSDGRGNEFGDINGKYGTVDYDNIMEFTDEMLRCYPDVDVNRVGVTGGSYGGFMTNWIIGHTDRFAAAASQRSIANWIAFEHTSDIGPFFTPMNQASTTRTDVEKMWWHSPLKYADRCTTPTLFIHSDADYRCWMVEGLSMFTALKMHGCEARLCLFKGESHELSRSGKPQNRIRRMEEILGWMDKHLK